MSLYTDELPIPIEAQIKCVEREIDMRIRVYGNRVRDGKMKQAQADAEIAAMRAVLRTLNGCAGTVKIVERPLPIDQALAPPTFQDELERLLNSRSMENGSNTPDFLLAHYLSACLESFDYTVRERESWYGRNPDVGPAGIVTGAPDTPGPCPECGMHGTHDVECAQR